MKGLVIFFCFFSGCRMAAAIDKTIMLFPEHTDTGYVILNPTQKVLKQISVCLRSYSELLREHSLFSLATPNKYNAILIYLMSSSNMSITVNDEEFFFRVDPEVLDWKSTCVTWDSETGLLQLWINGKRYPRRVTRRLSPIGPEIKVILGQDQDNFGGGFEAAQSFEGEIEGVNMWDYVLPPAILKAYFADYYSVGGNIYSWVGGKYSANGPVLVLNNQFFPKGQVEAKCCKPI